MVQLLLTAYPFYLLLFSQSVKNGIVNGQAKSGRRTFYVNEFAVQIDGSKKDIDHIAKSHGFVNNGKVLKNYYAFTHPLLRKRSIRRAKNLHIALSREAQVKWFEQQVTMKRYVRDLLPGTEPNDLLWKEMWHLNKKKELNVELAWSKNFTGHGIVVAVVDDGLEKDHRDLTRNFDQKASTDIRDKNDDPTPKYYSGKGDSHGTLCAGVIGAEFNNGFCGVGVAYNAHLGGIKLLNGQLPTDIMEAMALSFNRQYIDIYSNSWGPPDSNGDTFEGPRRLAMEALKDGVHQGRKGRGSIFVWASGNGGNTSDNCNCDGYSSNVYTITISAATNRGEVPFYAEQCSSSLVTTYSSGGDNAIVSTDIHSQCGNHTATSAATPLAAAIIALTLQANPKLTWRDMQHIIVRTAKSEHLKSNDWAKNAAGFSFSHWFGFGLMDAGHMIELAQKWKTVPEWKQCVVQVKIRTADALPGSRETGEIIQKTQETFVADLKSCKGSAETNVVFLESVQARLSVSLSNMASKKEVQIFLTSPTGTKSTLLSKRPRDNTRSDIKDWYFTSVHFWGEELKDKYVWSLTILNDNDYGAIKLEKWEQILYGTSEIVGPEGVLYGKPPNHNRTYIEKCCSWDRNFCSGCADGLLLYDNGCVQSCPVQNYESRTNTDSDCPTSSCRRCASPLCEICIGPEPNMCTTCSEGFHLDNDRCIKN